ncbi:MAG: RiPP maturation radical SAM protein 1 [Chloroflexi bacterium]|nr:RiPP maturation radical SAM protein 1 [Chloroflexota bacterium]
MNKVLLLSMPFGALERQALGLSLLKGRLAEATIGCDIRYLTFTFAELIGYEDYQWMSFEVPYTAFAGDWCFTRTLYGERLDADGGYIHEVLRETWQLDESSVQRILGIRALTPHFLDHCMAAIAWDDYAVVGFTSTFEQNIASLALAKRIKAAYPSIAIVFGGANWEAGMGRELHRRFPFVDYGCSGEAEDSFPALVRRILDGEPIDRPATAIPGIVYRAAGESVYTGHATPIRDLDRLPVPDFDDYFRDLAHSTVAACVSPTLLLETSRGCWWGAKSHCTFCGLNGGTMAFRSKSAERALQELSYLTDRWQIDLVEAVDNILDMRYFNDVLPALGRAKRPIRLFYEVKANLTRAQIQILHQAGVHRIQPGLESMSDHVLKLMRKGTTALRNIQLLKWCKEYGISVDWNVLYGFPGETREDYAAMLDLFRSIRFLQPPVACGQIRLDRFSPYFESPAEFGFTNVRPFAPYTYLYPFGEESLREIAYYFDYDYEPEVDPTGYASEVIEFVRSWQLHPETGTLSSVVRPDGRLLLVDTRSDAAYAELVLSGLEQAAYSFCDELHSGSSVAGHLRRVFTSAQFTERHVLDFLDSLVANQLMVTDGVNYLSLAIPVRRVEAVENGTIPLARHTAQSKATVESADLLTQHLAVST